MKQEVLELIFMLVLLCSWNLDVFAVDAGKLPGSRQRQTKERLCIANGGSGDLLRFAVTTDNSVTDNRYVYHTFFTGSIPIQAGDRIEYDVYLTKDIDQFGGIELYSANHPEGWRDLPGWQDQNGVSGHPAATLTDYALFKWYHRELIVPISGSDEIMQCDVAAEWEAANLTATAYYDNIRVTRGPQHILVATLYEPGPPPASALHFQDGCAASQLFGGPSRKPESFIATHLILWYGAPDNVTPDSYVFHPPGMIAPYHDEWYNSLNFGWYKWEIADMKLAGVDYILPFDYGDSSWFGGTRCQENLVNAILETGSDLKIGMFEDGWNQICEWNEDNGRESAGYPLLPLTPDNWHYFYELKIRPYFQRIPRFLWATHNGLPAGRGGRPIINAFGANPDMYFTHFEHAVNLWADVKKKFVADFDVEPWLILDEEWFNQNPGVAAVADGETFFQTTQARFGGERHFTIQGRTTSELGPGFDNGDRETPDLYTLRTDGRALPEVSYINADTWLTENYIRMPDSHLTILETWNELNEATGLCRAIDYPAMGGGLLPETFYMEAVYNLRWTKPGVREWDETFTSVQVPLPLKRGSVITFAVRNDGMNPWPVTTTKMTVRLIDPITGVQIKTTDLAKLGREVIHRSEWRGSVKIPGNWPLGNYTLELDLKVNGIKFADRGDRPFLKPVALTRAAGLVGIKGTVTWDGANLKYAAIRAFDCATGIEVGRAFSNTSGYYELGLYPGRYRLECRKYGYFPWPAIVKQVTVPSRSFVTRDFSLAVQAYSDDIVDFSWQPVKVTAPLDGPHPRPFPRGIDFGTGAWGSSPPWGGLNDGPVIFMGAPEPIAERSISLPPGKRLKYVTIGGEGLEGTVTFRNGNPAENRIVNLADCPQAYALNWANPTPTVNINIKITNGHGADMVPFDNFIFGD